MSLPPVIFHSTVVVAIGINAAIAYGLNRSLLGDEGGVIQIIITASQGVIVFGWGAMFYLIAVAIFQKAAGCCHEKEEQLIEGKTAQLHVARVTATEYRIRTTQLVFMVFWVATTIFFQMCVIHFVSEKGITDRTAAKVLQLLATGGWFVISTNLIAGIMTFTWGLISRESS